MRLYVRLCLLTCLGKIQLTSFFYGVNRNNQMVVSIFHSTFLNGNNSIKYIDLILTAKGTSVKKYRFFNTIGDNQVMFLVS